MEFYIPIPSTVNAVCCASHCPSVITALLDSNLPTENPQNYSTKHSKISLIKLSKEIKETVSTTVTKL